jgi:2-keto-4-pentenoate hydratase
VNGVDPRLVRALRTQLQARRGERVGWKLGVGDAERLGGTLSVGHLTTTTLLEPGATYDAAGARLHADAEIAVLIGDGYAAAIELVDLANAGDSAAAVVATNIFHRAVAFGQPQPVLPARLEGRLLVNGTLRAAGQAPRDVAARIGAAAEILAAVGERLETGDRVITGSVVQVPVQAGDEVTADFGLLGSVTVKLS